MINSNAIISLFKYMEKYIWYLFLKKLFCKKSRRKMREIWGISRHSFVMMFFSIIRSQFPCRRLFRGHPDEQVKNALPAKYRMFLSFKVYRSVLWKREYFSSRDAKNRYAIWASLMSFESRRRRPLNHAERATIIGTCCNTPVAHVPQRNYITWMRE